MSLIPGIVGFVIVGAANNKLLPHRTAPIKTEETRRGVAGGVPVHVRARIPILIHIPVRRGGSPGPETATGDPGLAPDPAHSATGPGPGRESC